MLSTWEGEVGGSEVEGHPWQLIHSEFIANVGYMRACLRNTPQKLDWQALSASHILVLMSGMIKAYFTLAHSSQNTEISELVEMQWTKWISCKWSQVWLCLSSSYYRYVVRLTVHL